MRAVAFGPALTCVALAALSGLMSRPIAAAEVTSSPTAMGPPHACDQDKYPVAAMQARIEGATTLAFNVGADGKVGDIAVKVSSGNADLDAASVACAQAWLYSPAMKDGVAIDMPWSARVVWKMVDPTAPPFDALFRATQDCEVATRAQGNFEPASNPTVLRVSFARGEVKSVEVPASSGNRDLDRIAANCWISVPPALSAALPEGYSMTFPVDWSLHR